jgi:multidrug efflux pump subunit AcrB
MAGPDFFPNIDGGQFILHVRANRYRIEDTAMICDLIEGFIRRRIPKQELTSITDNIGLPYSQLNYIYSVSGAIGAADADILVSLNANHRPTADYVRNLRRDLPREFPGIAFYFLPADMTTQILNSGLPAPIDVQIEGQDIQKNRDLANNILNQLRHVAGLTDLRIQQQSDYPKFEFNVPRTKAAIGGYTDRDITNSLLVALNGSFQTTPSFFLNWQNGVQYELISQTPQYRVQSLQDIGNIPITSPAMIRPQILSQVSSLKRGQEMEVVSHSTSGGSPIALFRIDPGP